MSEKPSREELLDQIEEKEVEELDENEKLDRIADILFGKGNKG